MRSAVTLEKNRGRIERRTMTTSTQDLAWADWPGLGQFLRLERSVTVHGETTTTVQYAITSLSPDRASPERLLDLWRGRWEIENRLFWVRDVVFGAGALLGNVRAGQTLVDMTTATVEVNREVAAALAEKNVAFADAPVARGVPAAENGTLAITVGASDDVFEAILPYLKCMGGDISHCGGIGNGQVLKLMNNMLIFQNVAALAEAMAIATRAGVERSKVFDILSKGSADSYAMRKHGAHMVTGDYPDDQFPVTYSLKDIGYALDLAEKCGVDAQSAKHAEGRLKLAAEKGYGNYYSPVIYRLFEE